MGERPDPMVEQHRVRQAAEHQAAVLPGLDDDRLQVVAERLAQDALTDAAVKARWTVVMEELRRRGVR